MALTIGLVALALAVLALWTAFTGQNGFAELGALVRGEPAFVRGDNG